MQGKHWIYACVDAEGGDDVQIYSQSEDFPESFWCGISCHAVFW